MTEQKHLPVKSAEQKIAEFVGGRFTPQEIAVIREAVAAQGQGQPPLNNAELCVYLKQAARARLDPFSKQIYAIRRGGRLTIQTGIDGFRAIAERTGTYAGSDDYRFVEHDPPTRHPVAATCTVYRIVAGQRVPTTRTVRWDEFGSEQGQWKKMPRHMLGKVAEAQALRAAFPNDLSGLYSDDELAHADGPREATEAAYTVRPEQAGDAEMAAVEAQAALEGRDVELEEPEWTVEAPAGEQGGGA